MVPRFKSKFLFLEIAVIAGMIGVGWALYETYGAFQDLSNRRIEPPPSPDIRQVQQVRQLAEFRERYLSLADRIEHGQKLMREGLEAFVRDRTVSVGRYLRETEILQQRIALLAAPKDDAERQKAQERLLGHKAVRGEKEMANDLKFEEFLNSAATAVSNHVASLNITEGQPLTPDIVQRKIARAADTEQNVTAAILEARARADRIDSLLARKGVELISTPARATQIVTPETQAALQLIMRVLAAVFLVQAAIVVVAFYRHLVVTPLHQRIIENATSAEFQRKLDHFARLATGLAHEIRNPLTAINIRLFTLQKSLAAGGAQHADTVLIRNEIDRLEQILKNFLRLARPSEPKLASLTAQPLLEETRALLADQCSRRGVSLRIEKVTSTPFLGDTLQLKQVLINLVQNAADSIEGDGRIIMRAYESRSTGNEMRGKSVVLEIEDTGCGITPDVQERLFDPFFSTKENGTGLGLPIAAKIVDQHKGRLEFDAKPGEGSTFRVLLPADGELNLNA